MARTSPGEWLGSVLGSRQTELPYPDGVRYIIKQHLLDLIQVIIRCLYLQLKADKCAKFSSACGGGGHGA
jgi:hypothetical protein